MAVVVAAGGIDIDDADEDAAAVADANEASDCPSAFARLCPFCAAFFASLRALAAATAFGPAALARPFADFGLGVCPFASRPSPAIYIYHMT